jgi:hypothetical protein
MSTSLVEKAIAEFVASKQPAVLCIRGKWGVGKTHIWKAGLAAAKAKDAIGLNSYAYVSLFGLNGLDELRYAIFENSVPKTDIGIEPSVETFQKNAVAVTMQAGRKLLNPLLKLPVLNKFAQAATQSLSFLSVRDKLICLDDLERKAERLSLADVMGLVADLKERRGCKIVLILNQDLLNEKDEGQYQRDKEKVIDESIEFAPDASDCVRIGVVGGTPSQDLLREYVINLDITNIRLIKKMERLVLRVVPLVDGLHENVLRQAVASIALLSWSIFAPKEAPTREYLLHKHGSVGDGELSDVEKKWRRMLDNYPFTHMDEFDAEILVGIERGFFDNEELRRRAEEREEAFKAGDGQGSLQAAWSLYHDSFDDNEPAVVVAIIAAFREHVRLVTPLNLSGTVKLLKDLGHVEQAQQCLDYYMQQRSKEGEKFFDLQNYAFGSDIDDPDVRAAFDEKHRSFKDERTPAQVLVRMAKNKGWGRDDITLLSKLTPNDFFQLFKSHWGEDFERIVRTSLQFSNMGGTGEEEKAISERAREALVRIGQESLLNRRRVGKFGVQIEEDEQRHVVEASPDPLAPLRAEQPVTLQASPGVSRSRAARPRPK